MTTAKEPICKSFCNELAVTKRHFFSFLFCEVVVREHLILIICLPLITNYIYYDEKHVLLKKERNKRENV